MQLQTKNLKNVLGLRKLLREVGRERLGQEERLGILLQLMEVSEGILWLPQRFKVQKRGDLVNRMNNLAVQLANIMKQIAGFCSRAFRELATFLPSSLFKPNCSLNYKTPA